MRSDEFFKAGHLSEAIEEQTSVVKRHPTDEDARHRLFVLLCFAGELERAEKHLDVLSNRDQRSQSASLIYRALLASECERHRVFLESGRPTLPPAAPEWAKARLEALRFLRDGQNQRAAECIDRAVASTPTFSGRLNDQSFETLRDYDDLLGTLIEVYAGGRYLWMPMGHLRRIQANPPQTALDTLWRPARLEDCDGAVADVYLPVLYPLSWQNPRDAIRLGRETEWEERGEFYTGAGQRVFLLFCEGERIERSLMDIVNLEFEGPSD